MYKRVLIPLDGSTLAERIVPFILDIAGPLDLDVVLVRVQQPIAPHAIEGTLHFTVDDIAARLKEAREYLAAVAADLRRRGLRVTTDARYGEPVAEIVAAARETGAGMIAMRAAIPVLLMRLTKEDMAAVKAA